MDLAIFSVATPITLYEDMCGEVKICLSSIRSSAEYRKEMVRILVARALNKAKEGIE